MSISHDEATKWSRKETFTGIVIGFVMGAIAAWFIIDYSHKENKESYIRQINDLKDEKNKLYTEKSTSEKNFAICQTEKTNLENSINQNYVSREEFNRCMQNNTQFANTNQRIKDENERLSSHLQSKDSCFKEREHLQQQLDDIREELKSGWSKGNLISRLTDQQIHERREQQQQLVEQLNKMNCQ
ncbi:hypothetical protein [Neisseria sp.]|uniref:hypothetical protein n=1 Tax=Neisseria sp. TaxID=192066 RepID=UPI0026DA7CE4|nr:hypothetical protein [Neisseria sp.]MDO4908140.1 hypothetical protein [Neisseria sp.]